MVLSRILLLIEKKTCIRLLTGSAGQYNFENHEHIYRRRHLHIICSFEQNVGTAS